MWKSEFWGEERRLLITGGGLDWKHERGEKREKQAQICADQTTGMYLEVGDCGLWGGGILAAGLTGIPIAASSLFQGQWGRRRDY